MELPCVQKTISTLNTINVAETPVALSDSIKILGVILDKNFTFDSHSSHVFQIMFLPHSDAPPYTTSTHRRCCQNGCLLPCRQSPRLRQLGTLRHLSEKLARLHRIQSTLARVVTILRERISISKMLSDLHWLLMKFPVDLKVATLTFKFLESGEPGYLYLRIEIATSRRTLRSSADTRKLSVIPSRTKIGA